MEFTKFTCYEDLSNFITNYNLSMKKTDKYIIVYSKFDTFPENDDNFYKSIIFDVNTFEVVSLSHKRIYYNDYLQISDIETNNYKKVINETLEGTTVTMYYHNNKWNISTTSYIEANKCYWKSKSSIYQLLLDCIKLENKNKEESFKEFCSKHDKSYIYVYNIVHYENIHLIDYTYKFGSEYTKLCFLFARNKNDLRVNNDVIKINHVNVIEQDKFEDYSILDVWNKEQYYSNHVKQIIYQGLVIRNLENDSIVKLTTHKYSVHNMVQKLKYPCSAEHYIKLYQLNMIDEYFTTFYTEMYYNNNNIKMLIHKMFRLMTNDLMVLVNELYDQNQNYSICKERTEIYSNLSHSLKKALYLIRGKRRKNINKNIIYHVLKSLNADDIVKIVQERYKNMTNIDNEDKVLTDINIDTIMDYITQNSKV